MDGQRELQELSRAQRRLSEQLRSNRSALAELTERSPVRGVIEEVIRTLVVQLKVLMKRFLQPVLRKVQRTIRNSIFNPNYIMREFTLIALIFSNVLGLEASLAGFATSFVQCRGPGGSALTAQRRSMLRDKRELPKLLPHERTD